MSPLFENIVWMVLLAAITAYIGTVVLPAHKYRTAYVAAAVVSMLCRYALVYYMYKGGTEAAGTDGLIYHEVAKNVAEQLKSGTPIWAVQYKYTWYTVLMGMQYAVFGVNRYAASFVNVFISVMSGFVLFRIAHGLKFTWGKSAAISLAYIFMPSMIVWTTDTRKESVTFFIILLIWYLVQKVLQERNGVPVRTVIHMVLVCILLWISTLLRIYMLYTLGGGILVGLAIHYLKTKRRMSLIFGVMILITCIVVTYTTILVQMDGYHALPLDRSEGGDENISDELGSIFKIIMSKDIPEAINGFLTQPHMEKVSRISDISGNAFAITAVKIEQLLWYLCLVIAIFGIIHAILEWNPYLLGLLAFIVSYSLINALICEDVGETYYRYRAAIVAPTLLIADYRPLFNSLRAIIRGRTGTIE
ncbi:MAG TPA: hypothetical protein PLD49_02700 [Thermoclostridium caenicola]|uniref:hypothetical protein n=1 Tax=Thermoclostridium caenicola TaxID=659425 RepID=UPI002C1820F2|nr:hypothetical protein [Thermoclostridium caenicola]HOK42561.1 hypothetical protein [Thermoclostridium caenicola]HOL84171.1 hypothetical protein [Thermoclostridium caenicola]HPO76244.1 hypothetical protein [Thermoclostridium caenicola]